MALRVVKTTETFILEEDVRLRKGLEQFMRLDGVGVRAGIIEGVSKDYVDGTSVVDVARWNHDGTKDIPSRPWLRLGFERNLKFHKSQMRNLANNVLLGKTTPGIGMALVGQQMVSMQRTSLIGLDTPPLSPRTIEAKRRNRASGRKAKSGHPADSVLIETGHLLSQHVFIVEGTGTKE